MTDFDRRLIFGVFSFLVAAAGWFYLFYSRAAQKLSGVENAATNRRRVRQRRAGGLVMVLLAISFYVGCDAIMVEQFALAGAMFLLVLVFLTGIITLALLDIRLTRKLRRETGAGFPGSQPHATQRKKN